MTIYFVSIREGDKFGPTVWAGNVDASGLMNAKNIAEREFLAEQVCPSSDPTVMQFYATIAATRARCVANGFVVMGHVSKAKNPDCFPRRGV